MNQKRKIEIGIANAAGKTGLCTLSDSMIFYAASGIMSISKKWK